MSDLKVRLDNLQDEYYAGDRIMGKVICSIVIPEAIEEIHVCLEGAEHTRWRQKIRLNEDFMEFSGDNTFLKLETRWSELGVLEPGEYEYLFELQLPKSLPGSYVGRYGCVDYIIKATVKNTDSLIRTKKVNIIAPINLNEIKNLQLDPVSFSEKEAVCSWLFCNCLLSVTVHLNKKAFVLGEVATVEVTIKNQEEFYITGVHAKIWMTVKYVSIKPLHDVSLDTVLLTALYSGTQVATGRQRNYRFHLKLPNSATVPNFAQCRLLSQTCTLEVTAVRPGFPGDVKLATNIVVGHIPIEGQQKQEVTLPPGDNPWSPLPDKDKTHSSVTPVHAVDKHEYSSPFGYNINPFQTDIPQRYPPALGESAKRNFETPMWPGRPYPVNDNLAPYPPEVPKSLDSSHTYGAPYPPYKESIRGENVASTDGCTSTPCSPKTTYPDSSYRLKQSHPSDDHTSLYPPQEKDTTNTDTNPSETHKSVQLAVSEPTPYPLYHSSPTEYPPESSKSPYPPKSNAPCPSAMTQLERSSCLYPKSVPPSDKPTPHPPSSNPVTCPLAISKPDYSQRSCPVPYPQDTPKLPNTLDEAKHPHPINNKPQPPYPIGSGVAQHLDQRLKTSPPSSPYSNPVPPSDKPTPYPPSSNPAVYPLAMSKPDYSQRSSLAPYPHDTSKVPNTLDEAKHPHPINNKPQPPYPTGSHVAPHQDQRLKTSSSSGPYPKSVPPSDKPTPYPPSSNHAVSPLAMSKPDYPQRNCLAAYPQDASKLSNTLGEAKHPHPINNKSQPLYPTHVASRLDQRLKTSPSSGPYPKSVPSSDKPTPYPPSSNPAVSPLAMSKPDYPQKSCLPHNPQETSKPSNTLVEAKHPHPINNMPQPPHPTGDVASHLDERHKTSHSSGRNAVPYPVDIEPSISNNLTSPALPPKCDLIGFAVPTSATSPPEVQHDAVQFVPVPVPTVPYPPTYAASAPPIDDGASDHQLADAVPTAPLIAPTTYEEAISSEVTKSLNGK